MIEEERLGVIRSSRIPSSRTPNPPSTPSSFPERLSAGRPALQANDLSVEVALVLDVGG